MSFRLFFAMYLVFGTTSSFSQMVPPERAELVSIGGQWGDVLPPKTEVRAVEVLGSSDPLLPWQEELFQKTGYARLLEQRGAGFSHIRGAAVVVMGTGVDANHPDLVGRVDCAVSETFIEGGGDPCVDEYGHDTAVATIGFANGGDGIGMKGFANNTRIISLKVMTTGINEFGRTVLKTSLDAIIKAFRRVGELALTEEAVIVIAAFSIDGVDPTLRGLFAELEKQDRVYVVSSTDNIRFLNSETQPGLPCSASTLSNVDCVATLTMDGGLAPWSAYGKRITQTGRAASSGVIAGYPGGRYGNFLGNSGSAPQVAALASLVWGYAYGRGRNLTAAELKMLMQRGASFSPGLVSAIVQYEVATPHTLDAYRLFEVVDLYLEGKLQALTEGTLRVSGVKSGEFGVATDLKVRERYTIVGQGFSEGYLLLLNGMPIRFSYSGEIAEFELPEAASFFSLRGGDNVLYFARVDEEGRACPFSVTKVLSGFQIR